MPLSPKQNLDYSQLATQIKAWGMALGFQQIGITGVALDAAETHLLAWLKRDRHGQMDYMARHGTRRSRPQELLPGTQRIIAARMDYLPAAADSAQTLQDPAQAFISRYALGRDYHKLIRRRLQQLVERIEQITGPFLHRAFCDSAPVLEKAIAEQAGLGWIGKHTLLISRRAGSWFFLGEIYTDLPLPVDTPASEHCGACQACLDICPTGAIVGPRELDARRCISYLTIELRGSIPEALRPLIGNRIFGCDDCQLVCPWNRFAQLSVEQDFQTRHELDSATLITLFNWNEAEFLRRTEGSAIRRVGYEGWLRNLAVALGNSPSCPEVIDCLATRLNQPSILVREHVEWALQQHATHSRR